MVFSIISGTETSYHKKYFNNYKSRENKIRNLYVSPILPTNFTN